MEMPRRELPVVLESKPLGLREEFESRRSIEEKIMGSFKDENVNTVGIFGVGGVGKTRMARRIGEKVKVDKLFKFVVMVRVGPNCDLERILYEISYYLGVRVELGNFVATARLIVDERILIILDDVREIIDLKKIGIPLQNFNGLCKIMIISRSRSVCSEMGAQVIFSVRGLTEKEMWILLREKAGNFINSSDFHPLAKRVVEKCGGLPLAITFAARILKEMNKFWPGGVAEANLGLALSYESRSIEEMVARGNFYVEREVVDMLKAEINNVSSQISSVETKPKIIENLISSLVFGTINHDPSSVLEFPPQTLFELDLQGTDIQILPSELKKLNNLRLLNLTNCWHLQTIEAGLISSLVCLEELYMLGSFSEWEVEKEGEKVRNASINELGLLPDLIALQIQVQDLNIIPKSWCWTRLAMYVISTPRELKCRLQESLDLSFPAVNWQRAMLRNTERLHLAGDGSKNAVDELISEGFKLLKKLEIGHCSTMEYLVSEVDQLPILESLSLEDLPLFMEISRNQLPVGFFRELSNLKLCKLPALLHVYRSPCQSVSFSNLKNVHISHCPKLRSLFPLSTACNLRQLEEIKIEYCEMMEEIFSEERCEDGGISKEIEFLKLNYLKLHNLPNLIGFCKNVRIVFPELRVMSIQSLPKLRTFCPTEGAHHFKGIDDNHVQFLFNEKITFGSLKKLEVLEIVFCDALRILFTHSLAEAFVQLKHLIVEHCFMMQEVIGEDGGKGHRENEESLFPQLKTLELRRLPKLESFYHMINSLELPSLEDLIIHDCPGMNEFCGGRISMPMLKYVKRDFSVYRIDGISYTIEPLFKEKDLFVHQPWPVSSQYQGAEVEVFTEEELMKELSCSHPEPINHATAGNRDANLQYDMNQKVVVNPPESYWLVVGEEMPEKDVSKCEGTKANEGQKEDIASDVSKDMLLHDKEYMRDCILFCSIFPSDYQFTKDMLVWQWVAVGLIKSGEVEVGEEVYNLCFDILLDLDYIVAFPRCCVYGDEIKHKIGDKMKEYFLENHHLLEPRFQKSLDSKQTDVAKVEHLSISLENLDCIDFGILKKCSRLQTLMIHRCYGSIVKRLPSDLFSEMKTLKILNLSHTNIDHLCESVENLEELRYLDMSHTPLSSLSDSDCPTSLQTLNLHRCVRLYHLPECTSKLINLRHLVTSIPDALPSGIGNLTKLQTLMEFWVGAADGYRITELKDMNKLKGSLCILYLENCMTKEEASEARLCNKHGLKKIELNWTSMKNQNQEEIIECLQPPKAIQELTIYFYGGRMLPSWISNPSFEELVSITIYGCSFCKSLPSLGELPSLKCLHIYKNEEVIEINGYFCRKQLQQTNDRLAAFPKLEKLKVSNISKLEKWTGIEKGDFPCLKRLDISYCPKFVHLPFLSDLSSLLEMRIKECPEVSCLPVGGLPATLKLLSLSGCPKLEGRCCNEQCEDWSKVAHVPTFYIKNKKILDNCKLDFYGLKFSPL